MRRRWSEHGGISDRAGRRTRRSASGAGRRHRWAERRLVLLRRRCRATVIGRGRRAGRGRTTDRAAGRDHRRRAARAGDRAAIHARVRARGRRAPTRARARKVCADRDRLRNAGARSRPGGAREGLARGVGPAGDRQRRAPRRTRARGGQPVPPGPRDDHRPPRRTRAESGDARPAASRRATSGDAGAPSQPSRPPHRASSIGWSSWRRCRCRRSRGCWRDERANSALAAPVAPGGSPDVSSYPPRRGPRCWPAGEGSGCGRR